MPVSVPAQAGFLLVSGICDAVPSHRTEHTLSLCMKAAKGAGLSPGQAEAAGGQHTPPAKLLPPSLPFALTSFLTLLAPLPGT